MVIDDKKKYVLTNYISVKNKKHATDSDHFTSYMDVDLKLDNQKPERLEIFKFKDIEGQSLFKKTTTNTTRFTSCLKTNQPLVQQVENWQTILNQFIGRSFKKFRIRKRVIKKPKHPQLLI